MKLAVIALANFLGVAAANAPPPLRVVDTPPFPVTNDMQAPQPEPRSAQGAPHGVEAAPHSAQASPHGVQSAPRNEPPRNHVCFSTSETREKIAQHRLSDPLRALRAGRLQGEALRAKLCRFKQDDYVYEVYVLRRDGHLVRLYMNAQNGLAIAAPSDNDRN